MSVRETAKKDGEDKVKRKQTRSNAAQSKASVNKQGSRGSNEQDKDKDDGAEKKSFPV